MRLFAAVFYFLFFSLTAWGQVKTWTCGSDRLSGTAAVAISGYASASPDHAVFDETTVPGSYVISFHGISALLGNPPMIGCLGEDDSVVPILHGTTYNLSAGVDAVCRKCDPVTDAGVVLKKMRISASFMVRSFSGVLAMHRLRLESESLFPIGMTIE